MEAHVRAVVKLEVESYCYVDAPQQKCYAYIRYHTKCKYAGPVVLRIMSCPIDRCLNQNMVSLLRTDVFKVKPMLHRLDVFCFNTFFRVQWSQCKWMLHQKIMTTMRKNRMLLKTPVWYVVGFCTLILEFSWSGSTTCNVTSFGVWGADYEDIIDEL